MEPKIGENPYISARREWNERYGDFVKQASVWRLVAFISLGTTLVATIGVVYIGSKSKLVPIVVGVNDLGQMTTVGIPGERPIDDKVINATLADWMIWHRSVVSDVAVEESYVSRVYAYLNDGSPARASIDEWYKKEGNNPYERMKNMTVTVEIKSVLLMSAKTYQIDWKEITKNKGGQMTNVAHFRSIITIENYGVNPKSALLNPLGMYIQNISVQQI